MRRIIPGKIEVKTKIIKNITITDMLLLFFAIILAGVIAFTTLNVYLRLAIAVVIISIAVLCILEINTKKGYQMLGEGIAYIFRKKKTSAVDYLNAKSVEMGRFMKIGGLNTAVIELDGLDFAILDEEYQDMLIRKVQDFIEDVDEGSFLKMDRPVDYSKYLVNIARYKERIEREFEGEAKEKRLTVLNIHQSYVEAYQNGGYTTDCYYILLKDNNEKVLEEQILSLKDLLKQMNIENKVIEGEDLNAFLGVFFQSNEGKTPEIKERYNSITLDGVEKQILAIGRYPFILYNAWASQIFAIEGVTAVFNFKRYGGKNLEKNLHNAIREINGNIISETKNQSSQRRAMGQAEILDELINDIVFRDERIYDTQFYIMFDKKRSKEITKLLRHIKVKTDLCYGLQKEAYLNMLPYSRLESNIKRYNLLQMSGNSISGSFPFVNKKIEDDNGIYLGYNRNSIFFDIFKIDEERTNANMVILGQSGQGKSFTMKKILCENACKNTRIYILDPEDEYRKITEFLDGNYLDVAGSEKNKINPLQIFPSLNGEDEAGNVGDDITLHRVFLEQFMRTICPSIPDDCMMYFNRVLGDLYTKFKITSKTDLQALESDKYPIFDDLYDLLLKRVADKKNTDFETKVYNELVLYVEQFAKGGVYSNLWNGYTTLDLDNRFNVLNFRSLLANNNRNVANAQMLLVMRYLNLEIIKNKTWNDIHCHDANYEPQNCLVVADEAHNFIDRKFTVALDFMKNMSKQIRKYRGAFWIATQNISDFVGQSEEIKAKATAVLDNCKLSIIFSLQPNDINNMIQLYKSSRPFTESEKDILRSGKRGHALLKITNDVRVPIKIEAFAEEIELFD